MLKAHVAKVLKQYFGLACIYHDCFIGIHKKHRYWLKKLTKRQALSGDFWPHKPDIIVTNQRRSIIVEIDGDIHWMTKRGIKQTNDRNKHYEFAHIGLIWLTNTEAQNHDGLLVNLLAERLERYGVKPIN